MNQLSLPGFAVPEGALPEPGFVYFGSRGAFIKIGFSQHDPLGRCQRLGLRPVLIMRGTEATEAEMHKRFRKSHTDREWFIHTPEIAGFIAENCNTTIDVLRSAA